MIKTLIFLIISTLALTSFAQNCSPNNVNLVVEEINLGAKQGLLREAEKNYLINSAITAKCDQAMLENILSLSYKAILAKVYVNLKEELLNRELKEEASSSPYQKYIVASFESCQSVNIVYLFDGSYTHDWLHPYGQVKINFNFKNLKTASRLTPDRNQSYLSQLQLVAKEGTLITVQKEKFEETPDLLTAFIWSQLSEKVLLGPLEFNPFKGQVFDTVRYQAINLYFPTKDNGKRAQNFETNINLAMRACAFIDR